MRGGAGRTGGACGQWGQAKAGQGRLQHAARPSGWYLVLYSTSSSQRLKTQLETWKAPHVKPFSHYTPREDSGCVRDIIHTYKLHLGLEKKLCESPPALEAFYRAGSERGGAGRGGAVLTRQPGSAVSVGSQGGPQPKSIQSLPKVARRCTSPLPQTFLSREHRIHINNLRYIKCVLCSSARRPTPRHRTPNTPRYATPRHATPRRC